jgi:hypothetical protein
MKKLEAHRREKFNESVFGESEAINATLTIHPLRKKRVLCK